jgi:crotonobetainyl-CoA:carnitine CoA-transferase CaiB-like acyl-CoA transferase
MNERKTLMPAMTEPAAPGGLRGFLGPVRVLEIGSELGEYCGKLLAGLGADVVRVEPPGGDATRSYGPFYHDEPHPDRSLYFWHYNLGKRAIELDLDSERGRALFARLAGNADIVIDSRPRGYLDERGLGYEQLRLANPRLVYSRISPFGDTGPWADYEAGDLVHLALGGVMMNCGYDPDPFGQYDTPPIAPQMWQAYHIAGEMAAIAILGALNHRLHTGKGQHISTAVHDAVSKNTETDLPDWVFLRQAHRRLTCRHSMVSASAPALSITKDGRYLLPYLTYLKGTVNAWDGTLALLKEYGMQADLEDPRYADGDGHTDAGQALMTAQTDAVASRLLYARDLWRQAQAHGLPWAPVRKPEENLTDDHWAARGTFTEVYHPELDETFTYVGPRWLCGQVDWSNGPRPPLVGEHTGAVLEEWATPAVEARPVISAPPHQLSMHGKPFALSGVRVVDLSWMLASAGAGRFLAAFGAEVIKVEHLSRPDGMRFGLGGCPPGGRAERDRATGPLPTPAFDTPNRGGSFMEINAGKLGMSLNLKNPQGREILRELIRDADIVIEGFSPGTMARMGLDYEELKKLNPDVIYIQQTGFGQAGTYGNTRAYGPTAAAVSGLSDMSGLPEPFPPAGIGYSYLDWFGAYNAAFAMLAALYRRDRTGEGCYIDASQAETGIYLLGSAVLDRTVNGRRWSRYGNRSPYKPAAPHGAYRTRGEDRWIALSCFTEEQWQATAEVLGSPQWAADERFATLQARLAHQDELDALVESATAAWDGYSLMDELQARKVAAGVCQTAQDRYETDPQLTHLGWLVELEQTEIGRWPVKGLPSVLSETPAHIGGSRNRSGPNYGEDTDDVLSRILSRSAAQIAQLREAGAL